MIGGHEWREVEEQEAAQDLPADGRAASWRERGVTRLLMQTCEVAIYVAGRVCVAKRDARL